MQPNNTPIYFLISHPIQYYAPLFKKMTASDLNLEVWYCSDETIKQFHDDQFNIQVKWDIPLLDGYRYRFLKNNSWKPSLFNGFFGLINFEVVPLLFKSPRGIIILHGWNRATMILAIITSLFTRHKIWMRSENPLSHEKAKSPLNRFLKKGILGALFSLCDKILFIGKQNKAFYKYYFVPERKLIFSPYAVDNARFVHEAAVLRPDRIANKIKLGIGKDAKIILFCGKFIAKKAPLDLLKAFNSCNNKDAILVFVGEGELRQKMEAFIKQNKLNDRVLLTGFQNQSQIAIYYSIADVFVLPSDHGETWGLVVNEAMNFNLPVIVSDRVGSSYDLISKDNHNGIMFPFGDIDALQRALDTTLELSENGTEITSQKVISMYSYDTIIGNIKDTLGQH